MATPLLTLRYDLQRVLTGLLGTYTLLNGATTPAISVRDDGERVGIGSKVKGLELVISRQPNPEPVRQYLEESCQELWPIWLCDWGTENVSTATERICAAYPGTTVSQITTPERWGPRRQVQLLLRPTNLPVVAPAAGDGCYILMEDGSAMLPENCPAGVGP